MQRNDAIYRALTDRLGKSEQMVKLGGKAHENRGDKKLEDNGEVPRD